MKTNITKWEFERERQDMNDLYRQYPDSTIHLDYEEETARLSTNGKDEGVIIFGTTFRTLKKFARGAKTSTVAKVHKRVRETFPAKQ